MSNIFFTRLLKAFMASIVLFLAACSSSSPDIKSGVKKITKQSTSKYYLYLKYDTKTQSFTNIRDNKPRYGVELHSMKPIGFNISTSKDEVTPLLTLGKEPNYRIRECKDGSSSFLVNLSPLNLAMGGACTNNVHFDYNSFNNDIETWLSINNILKNDFLSKYDKIKNQHEELKRIYSIFVIKKKSIHENYNNQSSRIKERYTISYDKSYTPVISKDLILKVKNNSYQKYIEFNEFSCITNCISELVKFEKTIDSTATFQDIINNDIKRESLESQKKLHLLESSLKQQQLEKLRDDSKIMISKTEKYHNDLSKFKFSKSDTVEDMIKKNKQLKVFYMDATLSSEDRAAIASSSQTLGEHIYYQSIAQYNDIDKAYIKDACGNIAKKYLPLEKDITMRNCLKGARYY